MRSFFAARFRALKTTGPHWLRQTVGMLLVVGGVFGFLPVLGYWMLPLGLALLAVDFPIARRLNRNLQVWWGRFRQRQRGVVPRRARVNRTPNRHSGNTP